MTDYSKQFDPEELRGDAPFDPEKQERVVEGMPGSPRARFSHLMGELSKRFPEVSTLTAAPPELAYLKAIDRALAVVANQKLIHRIIDMLFNEDESLFLRGLDDGLIHAYMPINDVFMWGCADLEQITAENIDAFEQALKDVQAVNPTDPRALPDGRNYQIGSDAGVLFACRNRKQRPFKHEGVYPVHASVVPLIDALPFPDNTRRGVPAAGKTIEAFAKIENGVELSQAIEDHCGQPPEPPETT